MKKLHNSEQQSTSAVSFTKTGRRLSARIFLAMIAVIATLSLSSCGDEYYDYVPFEGGWELVDIDGYPVMERDVVEFFFDSNGTGTYGQYNSFGVWSEYRMTWFLEEGAYSDFIRINVQGGGSWYYRIVYYGGELELTDMETGQRLLFQRY